MHLSDLDKFDSKGMFRTYDKWPEIAKESFQKKNMSFSVENIDHVIFAGMGGSGNIGDVIASIFSKENIHVNVTKGYVLPKTVDCNTLIVVTSVSGNTQESLSILKQANELEAKVIAFSSGGKMEKYCIENKILFQKIIMEHSPRASLPKFLFSMLNILKNIIPITEKEVLESISSLEKTRNEIYSGNLKADNTAYNIAKWITNTPVIYYPRGLNSVAIRFKNSLYENSKIHVISEEVLEVCHNGIVAWESDKTFQPILIRGKDDHEKTKERWNIIKDFFIKENINFLELNSIEGNILTKIINLIYITDYASIYHAILHENDPSPVSPIEFIKSKLL
jgi:glucose/mannose-6-phosphate isomerase